MVATGLKFFVCCVCPNPKHLYFFLWLASVTGSWLILTLGLMARKCRFTSHGGITLSRAWLYWKVKFLDILGILTMIHISNMLVMWWSTVVKTVDKTTWCHPWSAVIIKRLVQDGSPLINLILNDLLSSTHDEERTCDRRGSRINADRFSQRAPKTQASWGSRGMRPQ